MPHTLETGHESGATQTEDTLFSGATKWFIRQVAPFQSCPKLEEP